MEFFLQKQLAASSNLPFSQKSSIINIRHGSNYVFELLNSICFWNTDDNTAFPSSEIQVKY